MKFQQIRDANAIDLLRIVSALLIVNYHTGVLDIPYISFVARFGFIFNTVFVFISGYLLATSSANNPGQGVMEFIRKRVARIYPSFHIALIVIGIIYIVIGREIDIPTILLTITGFQYYTGHTAFGGHLWFVTVVLTCYLLFKPTFIAIRKFPVIFILSVIGIFFLVVFFRESSLDGIYLKISDDPVYRFIYHYIAFSLGIYLSTRFKEARLFSVKQALLIVLICAPLYVWLKNYPVVSAVAVLLAFVLSLSVITLIVSSFSFVSRHFPLIFLLSSISYELYLVHVSVIDLFDHYFHGAYFSYPLVFVVSITLAFIIYALSRKYSWLIGNTIGKLLQ